MRYERRPLQRHDERERAAEEQRVERRLGHERPGVDHRRHSEREHRDEQRERRTDDAAREQVRRDRRERHDDRAGRLREPICSRHRCDTERGCDQQRIDEAEAVRRDAADQERPVCGGRLRELGVDELVDHDPRRDHAPREHDAEQDRQHDDRREPHPGRQRCGARAKRRAHVRMPAPRAARTTAAGSSIPTSAAASAMRHNTASATASPPAAVSSASTYASATPFRSW